MELAFVFIAHVVMSMIVLVVVDFFGLIPSSIATLLSAAIAWAAWALIQNVWVPDSEWKVHATLAILLLVPTLVFRRILFNVEQAHRARAAGENKKDK